MNFYRIFSIFICTFFGVQQIQAQTNKINYYTNKKWSNFTHTKEVNTVINPENLNMDFLNALLFHLTNQERTANKKQPLQFHQNLQYAAQEHSDQMVEHHFFSHINHNNQDLKTPSDRIFKHQKDYMAIGENIVENNLFNFEGKYLTYSIQNIDGEQVLMDEKGNELIYATYEQLAKRLIHQWMTSPPHKKNILSNQFSLMACACSLSDYEEILKIKCTQNFGKLE